MNNKGHVTTERKNCRNSFNSMKIHVLKPYLGFLIPLLSYKTRLVDHYIHFPHLKIKVITTYLFLKLTTNLRYTRPGRGVSEKISAVSFCLGSGLFGSCNSD